MSIEGLLLLVFFLVTPLIQQWVKEQKKKEQARLPREHVPPALPVPAAPPIAIHAREKRSPRSARPSAPTRAMPPDDPVVVARAARVHRRQPRVSAAGLSTRSDLRQAILRMIVLGPCRANLPYGADRPDGSPSTLSP